MLVKGTQQTWKPVDVLAVEARSSLDFLVGPARTESALMPKAAGVNQNL